MDFIRTWETPRLKASTVILLKFKMNQVYDCYSSFILFYRQVLKNVIMKLTLSLVKGFQTRLGYIDVKLSPTYFYVQRTAYFNTVNISIPFEIEVINIGGAMNLTSGIFTAPTPGLYFFTFSGFVGTSNFDGSYFWMRLMMNDTEVSAGAVRGDGYDTLALQSTLKLNTNDRVWLKIAGLLSNALVYEYSTVRNIHFTGQLLQEDIPQSFKLNSAQEFS